MEVEVEKLYAFVLAYFGTHLATRGSTLTAKSYNSNVYFMELSEQARWIDEEVLWDIVLFFF